MKIAINPNLYNNFSVSYASYGFNGNTKKTDLFDEFVNIMKINNLKTIDLQKNCKPENIIGSGQNSVVYKFDDLNFDNWVIKIDINNIKDNNLFLNPIKKVKNEFGTENMGQEIAKIGEHVHILKRIKGNPHSFPNWSLHRKNATPITKEESVKFLNSVKEIANFPQISFNNYARKLQLLDEKGYKADSFNPNNLIIDTKQKEIYIIDAYKYDVDAHLNTKYDLFCPLIDYANFDRYFEAMPNTKKTEFLKISKIIFNKCTIGANNVGLKTDERIFKDFISRIDRRENNNGIYTNSFNKVKKILEI